MKTMKYFIIALGVSLFAISCNKETSVEETTPVSGVKMVTATCTISDPDPDSKVSLNTTNGKTEWVLGDKIFIHGNNVGQSGETYYSYVATVTGLSADKKTATFEIPEIQKYSKSSYNSTLFAAYPAEAIIDFSNGATWYFYSAFKETNHLLLGGANDKDVNEGLTFSFLPLTGAISFTVDGSAFGGFDSYVFCGNNDETVGYTKYTFRTAKNTSGVWDNNYNGYKTEGPSPSSGELKNIIVNSWSGADGTTVNTVYFPNPDNFTFTNGFTIKFLKSGEIIKIAKVTSSQRIKRGELLNLGNITSHLKNPPAAPVNHIDLSDGLIFETATDLSATATANCYIVSAAGQYKFKMVKGNSSTSVGSVKGASIVWETHNDGNAVDANSVIGAVDYYINDDDEYVVFKTPAPLQPGNALLAVKDAMDNILWSWHIWIPASTIMDITDATFSSTAIMDRNLGALEKATTTSAGLATHGFFYEWGRKDPFPGSATVNTAIAFETVDGPKSTLYSEQNPTKHIKVVENDTAGNWNTDDINTLWDNSGKTQYDPCPPGYRVPKFNESYKLWVKNGDNWTFDWTNDYFKYDSSDPIFPLPGYISGSTIPSYPGERALIWSASYHSAPRGYCKLIRKDKGGYYYHNYFKMEAGSVRCVVE